MAEEVSGGVSGGGGACSEDEEAGVVGRRVEDGIGGWLCLVGDATVAFIDCGSRRLCMRPGISAPRLR